MNRSDGRPHWSFWLVGILTLVWNVLGCVNFIVQLNPDMVSSYRETEQLIIHGRRSWATAAFAFAVFGGAKGCVLLLLKKPIAYYFFVASLIGVAATMIHTLTKGIGFGVGEMIGIIIMPIIVAAFLVWYSKFAERKGWLKA